MTEPDDLLERMKAICLAFPDTKLTFPWGAPHFRVGEKIFSGCGVKDDVAYVSFKLEMDHQASVVKDPRCSVAPYVGKHGWVLMKVERAADWAEVAAFVRESYRLIAPKKSWAKLLAQEGSSPPAKAAKRPAKKRGTKRR